MILVTGGKGLVGYGLRKHQPNEDVVYLSSSDGDLTNWQTCYNLFAHYHPHKVLHMAARVGGVYANTKFIADFFKDNILINMNVLECCRIFHVEKVVSMLSTCIFPDKIKYPIKESYLHDGEPHVSNYGYAYAKRMLEVQSRSYNQQYKTNFICAVPNNIYGINDNFDLYDSHVIPAIIRKIYEAYVHRTNVNLLGDGLSLREFSYSLDIGKALWWLLCNYEGNIINIGTDEEIDIKTAANIIAKYIGYDCDSIQWDSEHISGQYRKNTDKTLFKTICPHFYWTPFEQGIQETINWFVNTDKSCIRNFNK